MGVDVFNLATGNYEARYVGITPAEAVVAAFAQFTVRDRNTWDYPRKYGHLVRRCRCSVSCGDFAAILPKEEWKE